MSESVEKLALEGGPKAVQVKIPFGAYGADFIGEEEENAVLDVLRTRRMSRICVPLRESYVQRFEDALKKVTGAPYAIAVNSGASALHVALVALNIGPGDEVIVPGIGWICCASTVINVGAMPIPVEIDESLTPDPADIERKITPRTKAIMVVHLRGQPADMDRVMAIARKHGVKVIEDVAQSLGATYKGKHLGTIGDVGAYSLNLHKVITAGEGGAVVMNDEQVFGRALSFSGMYTMILKNEHPAIQGIELPMLNLRLPELCGAVAYAQILKLDRILASLRDRRDEVLRGLAEIPFLQLAPRHDPEGECGYTLPLLFKTPNEAGFFFEAMRAEGVTNVSNILLGFSGGEIQGTYAMMAAQGLDPLDFRRLGIAPSWRCVTERFGPTDAFNPWKMMQGDPTPLVPGVIPQTPLRLARVIAFKFYPGMTSEHTAAMVRAARKVAAAMERRAAEGAPPRPPSPPNRPASAPDARCQASFELIGKRLQPPVVKDWSAAIQFRLVEGGDFFVKVAGGACQTGAGKLDGATLTVDTSREIWLEIADGKLEPGTAFLQGLLKVSASLGDLMKLHKLAIRDHLPVR